MAVIWLGVFPYVRVVRTKRQYLAFGLVPYTPGRFEDSPGWSGRFEVWLKPERVQRVLRDSKGYYVLYETSNIDYYKTFERQPPAEAVEVEKLVFEMCRCGNSLVDAFQFSL